MQARLWPHGSPGDAQHRPETRYALPHHEDLRGVACRA